MMEAPIFRLSHSSPQAPKLLAQVNIPGTLPITPKRIQHVLQTLILSSPSNRYSVNVEELAGKPQIFLKHQENDEKRLNVKRDEIATLTKRLDNFQVQFDNYKQEVARKQEEVARKQEEVARKQEKDKEPIYEWEVCSRLAQAIHNFLRRALMASTGKDEISVVEAIWGGGTHSSYLPHLYTLWWVKSHQYEPQAYPLPPPLRNFSTQQPLSYNSYKTMDPLTRNLEEAMITLWNSRYRPFLDIMLIFFLARNATRNTLQHPVPTSTFAMEFIKVVPGLSDSSQGLAMAALLIRSRFFDHGEEYDEVAEDALDTELNELLDKDQAGTGMDNPSQQDEEPPYKKAKFDA